MELKGCAALVTGANRGLGKAYAEALLTAGAKKVHAGARDPAAIKYAGVTALRLDATSAEHVAAAALACGDVNLLINNAGIMLATPVLGEGADAALRKELEVNVLGMLAMARAFAPVLARNGGGAIINMLSVASWYVYPFNATYCASKHAALAVTNALRVQLKAQGTQVIGVYAGFIDTDMAERVTGEKTSAKQVAERALAGVVHGQNHVRADNAAERVWGLLRSDPAQLEAQSQTLWDENRAWVVG